MKLIRTIILCIGTFLLLCYQNGLFAQTTYKTEITLNYIIYNDDTLSKDTFINETIKNNTLNRIIIWENGNEKVSAVIDFHRNKRKTKFKLRFDTWNGEKWKKPKLKLWCDDLHCSFNRWYSKGRTKGGNSTELKVISSERGFTYNGYFSEGDNIAIVNGKIKIIY